MTTIDEQERARAVMTAKSMVQSISTALSVDMAEQHTLHTGGYLTWAQSTGLIDKNLYDELTQVASDALRQWVPPSPI